MTADTDPRTSAAAEHEEAMVRAFVLPEKRQRLLDGLRQPKRRARVLQMLAHFSSLDPRLSWQVPTCERTPEGLLRVLTLKGAPERCHVISERSELDGRTMSLKDALQQVVGQGFGTLISCIPGRLAYYESEEPGQRFVLERSWRPG